MRRGAGRDGAAEAGETFDWVGPEAGFDAVLERHGRWRAHCEGLDPQRWDDGELVRWPYTDGRPFALLAGWVSMELTKNIAEMSRARSYHRHLRSSEQHPGR